MLHRQLSCARTTLTALRRVFPSRNMRNGSQTPPSSTKLNGAETEEFHRRAMPLTKMASSQQMPPRLSHLSLCMNKGHLSLSQTIIHLLQSRELIGRRRLSRHAASTTTISASSSPTISMLSTPVMAAPSRGSMRMPPTSIAPLAGTR